ncbi:MAG TPA: methionine--tRNA ligase [Anaerolineales bacterium]
MRHNWEPYRSQGENMPEKILIAIAWPYSNAEIHVGNLTGSHLPGDIVARYHRLKGNSVLMVSGTDSHGTPVTVVADRMGKPVEDVYKQYHNGFLEVFQKAGITYDLFTSTHTQNHFKVSQSIFLALQQNGYLFKQTSKQWYSPSADKFLPDRYVEGTCYICGFAGARSDQCDNCGNVLDPEKLIEPRATTGDGRLELRETEHYYLDLSKLEPEVISFLRQRADHMRDTVLGESLRKIETEGLKPRPITRDLDWGIPVPTAEPGWESKRLYVWFEAVIGYLSAAIEWAQIGADHAAWKAWWADPSARQFYFIGKDNIFFHTSLWPAELMGVSTQFAEIFSSESFGLTLPYDVPANQFMNLEGKRISGSRNWGVWGNDFLSRYDADALRYYLTVNMPEFKDSDWDWSEFVARNNNELVATWGNLANRVLSFAFRNWGGRVPDIDPAHLRPADNDLLAYIEDGFETVGRELEAVRLRAALQEAMRLASIVNQYLDQTAPWTTMKQNRDEAALSVYTALKAIDSLKVLFSPFLPFSSQQLHEFFGREDRLFGDSYVDQITDSLGEHRVLRYREPPKPATGGWKPSQLLPGSTLREPRPLFKKLDESLIEAERARLGK